MNGAKATIKELTSDPGQILATEGGEIAPTTPTERTPAVVK
jgi:hypothetical protein